MGEYKLIYTALAAIAVVGAIIGGRLFLVSSFANVDIQAQATSRELNAMSLSYALMDCFKEDGVVKATHLDQNNGMDICNLCEICSIAGAAKITDLETEPKKEWRFSYSDTSVLTQRLKDKVAIWEKEENKRKVFSTYLNIDYGDYSHVGRLDVNV